MCVQDPRLHELNIGWLLAEFIVHMQMPVCRWHVCKLPFNIFP